MIEPRALLHEYVTQGSEPAFREIVERYINLVYGTAVRLVDGDTHRAEDIVQTVFSDLARLAATLSPELMLGGWLHRRTWHVATTLMRSERRRQNRERQVMNAPEQSTSVSFDRIAPVLDEAINELGAEDRAAITLRFFEGRDLRSVGAALGNSEDAAQKRVARALEKLRGLLARRGVTASGAALAAVLTTQISGAAPAGLAASVSAAALAGATAGGSGLALSTLKLMSIAKLKMAVGAVLVVGLGTTLVVEQLALKRLREQNQTLERRVAQLRQAAGAPSPSADSQAATAPSSAAPDEQLRNLGRLRGEVGALRRETKDLPGLQAKNRELRAATDEPDNPAEAEFNQQTELRTSHLKQWGLSFILYARDHNEQYPETFEQASTIQGSEDLLGFDTNHFEIVYRGSTASVKDPGKTIIFREKEARRSPKGDWVRVYGFADGHVEAHSEPNAGAFAAWEKDRIITNPAVSSGSQTPP